MPDREVVMLRYVGENSDKGYQVILEPQGDGWVCNAANGRWGSTFVPQCKTPNGPVPYEKAKQLFDKVVKEKVSKGYKVVSGAAPTAAAAVASDRAERETGIHPQLLNPIGEDEAKALVNNPDYWAQEKFDGKRILIKVTGEKVTAINRKGLSCGVAEAIINDAKTLASRLGDYVMDGEQIGEDYFAFDLLEAGGKDIRHLPYSERLRQLYGGIGGLKRVREVETAMAKAEKAALYEQLKARGREGIVFKAHAALHQAGRPASGGNQLKLKFWATATVVVTARNDKRSVAVSVRTAATGGMTPVGNVTIPPGKAIPKVGDLVETKYLYAFPNGSLCQPLFIRVRDDVDRADSVGDLKFKSGNADAEDEA